LKFVTYDVDNEDNKFAICAIVNIPESTLNISGLSAGSVPISPVTSSFTFHMIAKKIHVRHTQLPILPGWAFMNYKIQGSTMPKIVINLTGAKSLQSMYVMLSRTGHLQDVAILRWFSSRMLHGSLQGDVWAEMQWLESVANITRQKYLSAHQNVEENGEHDTVG
ncbi:hypothetical protein BDR03DRAFT_873668, partial [Suillus americanus]